MRSLDSAQFGQPVLLVYEDSLFQLRRFADMTDFSEETFQNAATYLGLPDIGSTALNVRVIRDTSLRSEKFFQKSRSCLKTD